MRKEWIVRIRMRGCAGLRLFRVWKARDGQQEGVMQAGQQHDWNLEEVHFGPVFHQRADAC